MGELSPQCRPKDPKSTPYPIRSVTSFPPPPPFLQLVRGEIESGNGTAPSGETVGFNKKNLDDDCKAKAALRAAHKAAKGQVEWASNELVDAQRALETFDNAPEPISKALKDQQELVDLMIIGVNRFKMSFENDVNGKLGTINDQGSGIIEQAKRGAKEKDHEGELEEAEANAETRLTALREAKAKAEALYTDLRELKLEDAESNAVSLTTALREAETKAETLYTAVRELKQDKVEHKFVIANLERMQDEYERQAKAVQEAEESERSRKKEELDWKLSQAKNSLQAAKDNSDMKSRELQLFMEEWHKTPAGQALAGLKNTTEAKPPLNTTEVLPGVALITQAANEADQGQTALVPPKHGAVLSRGERRYYNAYVHRWQRLGFLGSEQRKRLLKIHKHLQQLDQLEDALEVFSNKEWTLDAALEWWRGHIIPCISDQLASVDLADVALVLWSPEARDQPAPESEKRLGRLSAVCANILRHDPQDIDRLIEERDGLVSKLWKFLNAGRNQPVAGLQQEAEMLLEERMMHVQAKSHEAADVSIEPTKKALKLPFQFTERATQGLRSDIRCLRYLHGAALELFVLDVPETTEGIDMSLIRDVRPFKTTVRNLGLLWPTRPPEEMQNLSLPALPDGAAPVSQVQDTTYRPAFASIGDAGSTREQSLGTRTTTMTDSPGGVVSVLEKGEFRKAKPPRIGGQVRSTYPLRTALRKATSDRRNHASAPPPALVSPSDNAIIPILEDVPTAEAGSVTPAAKFNPTAHPTDNDPSVASQGSTATSEEVDPMFNNPRKPPPTPKRKALRENPMLYLFPMPHGPPMPIILPSTQVQQVGQVQQDGNEEPPTQIVRAQTSTNLTDLSSFPRGKPKANIQRSASSYNLGQSKARKTRGRLGAMKNLPFSHSHSLSGNKFKPSEPTGKVEGEPKSGFDFD